MGAVHQMGHPRSTVAPGKASRMKESSLEHAWENPWATVRMAQLCSVMRRLASRSFDEQVAALATILDEDGYLADAERQVDGSWLLGRSLPVDNHINGIRRQS